MKALQSLSILAICLSGNLVGTAMTKANEIDLYTAAEWKSPTVGTFLYRHRAPAELKAGEKYPLLVFLHGAGGRGDTNRGQLFDAGGIKALENNGVATNYKSYIFAGQVPKGEQWVDVPWKTTQHEMPKISNSMRMLFESLDAFIADPKNQIDRDRVYVMGLSMGGYGTWDAIQRRPEFFAAAVPICGGGDTAQAKKLTSIPIWAWHGDRDKAIPVSRSRDMTAAIEKAGGKPKYNEIKGRGHSVWNDCWKSTELWDWLYEQKKTSTATKDDN